MGLTCPILYFALFILHIECKKNLSLPTHLFVTRVGPCIEEPSSVVRVSEMSIIRNNYDFTVSGKFNVTANLSNGWEVMGIMQKCMDMRNTDTCDYFKSIPVITDGCSSDIHKEDVSSILFHYTHPRLTCPIQVGSYELVDYPFYTEDNYISVAESKISTSIFGYTFQLEGRYNDKIIMCVNVHLHLLYLRDHKWINHPVLEKYSTKSPYSINGF